MKKILILCIVACSCFNGWSQNTINNYKYAVIPLQYEFLKGKDTYRLNTLTRVLFIEEGFETYFNEEQLPKDLFDDRCLAIYPDVKKLGGGPFRKKVQIIIKDCQGNIIFETEAGDSKENNHQKAYNEALRNAFKSVKKLKYKYQPNSNTSTKIQPIMNDEIEKEIEKVDDAKELVNIEKAEVKETSVQKEKIKTIDTIVEKEKPSSKKISNLLFPASINNGYQIRDEANKNVMVLLNTAAKNVFIVKGKSAIVFKEKGKWMYSENDGVAIVVKELDLKF